MKYFLLVIFILAPLSLFAATAQCPRYSAALEGAITFMGVTYHERLELHKVGGGKGYNGRWKVALFEQTSTYPWDLKVNLATNDVHNFGHGVTMQSRCAAQGNQVICRSTSDTMFLEVVGSKVRMEHTTAWHGKVEGNKMSWKFHLETPTEPTLTGTIAEGPKDPIELTVIEPHQNARYVYGILNPELELTLKAKTKPEQYAESIEWTVPDVEGVTAHILQGEPKGAQVDVVYKNLPEDVSAFGRKKVTATLRVGACTAVESRDVKFFYPRDAKNNPEGQYYNWFYYWKQTPAAKPFGQTVNIEFGGTQFDVCKDFHVPAMFKPAYLYKTIHVCDLVAKLDQSFTNRFPKVKRDVPATLTTKTYGTSTHIDTFAQIMRHEFIHLNAYHTWREGKTQAQMEAADTDLDGIPDSLEPGMGFTVGVYQTYWGNDPEWKAINGDEEFLAYESMYDYVNGTYDAHDWGKPGKNWP